MPDLVRSVTQPRVYRVLLVVTLATSLAATAYAIGRLEPAPITITTPPIVVPAPNVTVTPAPVTVTPAPAPIATPVVEPAPKPVPQPRALTPKVDAGCVILPGEGAELPASCAWDNGFPAIARDGSLIATMGGSSDGASDLYSVTIQFLDPKTARPAREVVILSEDEASAFVYPDKDTAKAEKIQLAIRTKVSRRVIAVQKTLDARKYRALSYLGGWDKSQDESQDESQDAPEPRAIDPDGPIYGELAGSAIRIIDPKSSTILWRGELEIARPGEAESTDMCGGRELLGVSAWWDPATRTVLASSSFRTGGCMCSDVYLRSVKRF
jgi:hypothetical protein